MAHDPLPTPDADSEPERVAQRYARRDAALGDLYSPLRPEVWQARQERQRAMLALLACHAPQPLGQLDVLEIGCGTGANLLELASLGFDSARLVGNELLAARAERARSQLPAATRLFEGDALALPFAPASFDIVLQSTVFSSLLDQAFAQRLAARMWDWVRPGGAVLWYDFIYDNPRNRDVRGVALGEVRRLFPQGRIDVRRVTLAPPLSRRIVRLHPGAYRWLNALPWLRTHVLCWIAKD
jgi:SAM-dependent methyltransferase